MTDRDPLFTKSVDGTLEVQWREVRADSGAQSKLQPARGKVRENDTKRMPGPLRDLRRAASAS